MKNNELYVDIGGGVRYFLVERYDGTTKSKKAVLLVHGVADGHIGLDLRIKDYSVIDYLAERNFVVYAPDLRGFGKSTITSGTDVRIENCAEDLKKVADFIKDRLKINNIQLAGFSFGAQVAMAYAAKYPDDINRLALICPVYRDVGDAMKNIMLPTMLDLINKGQGYYPNPTEISSFGISLRSAEDEVLRLYSSLKSYCPNNPTGPILGAVQGEDGTLPTDCYIPQIKVPTLLIAAANDDIAPAKNAKLLYQDLGTPDKKMVVIPNASHTLSLEIEGHIAMQEALVDWLKG